MLRYNICNVGDQSTLRQTGGPVYIKKDWASLPRTISAVECICLKHSPHFGFENQKIIVSSVMLMKLIKMSYVFQIQSVPRKR